MQTHGRCPKCDSFGTAPLKRGFWRRLFRRPNIRYCIDCGHRFMTPKE